MKKPLLIVLTLAMLLSLCACGGGGQSAEVPNASTETAITKDSYIGTWKRVFVNSDNDTITQTIEVYKGGTGKFTIHDGSGKQSDSYYNATWEINDDVLNFTYGSVASLTLGFELDVSTTPNTIVRVDDETIIYKKFE